MSMLENPSENTSAATGTPPRPAPPIGFPQTAAPTWGTATGKSPVLACLLSLMPGLGQVYVGYYGLGFIHAMVFGGTVTLLARDLDELVPLLSIFLAFFYLYNIVDAGRRAAHYNQVRAGIADVDMPREMSLPSSRGSLGLGIVLLAAGFLLLLHTALDFPLEWLESWWPLIPMLFGGYLVGREIMERSAKR